MTRTRLVLLDDQHLQADVLGVRLKSVDEIVLVGRLPLDNPPNVVQLERVQPDTVMIAGDALDASVLSIISSVVTACPSAHVVLVSGQEDALLAVAAGRAGADAWVDQSTSFEQLVDLLRGGAYFSPEQLAAVFRGLRSDLRRARARSGPLDQLTRREHEVIEGIARGLNDKALARALCISENTVRTHVANVFAKLGVHSRLEAAGLWRSQQLESHADASRL